MGLVGSHDWPEGGWVTIARKRSLWQRIVEAVEHAIDRFTGKPELPPPPPATTPERRPPPPPPPVERMRPPPEPEDVPPWEMIDRNAGPETYDREQTFDHMIEDLDIAGDEYAIEALWAGWFADNMDPAARRAFFDYTGMANYDFDWDQWREWYGDQAA